MTKDRRRRTGGAEGEYRDTLYDTEDSDPGLSNCVKQKDLERRQKRAPSRLTGSVIFFWCFVVSFCHNVVSLNLPFKL